MTYSIPIPADRHDYAGQNVQTRQSWKTSAPRTAIEPARTATAQIVLNRADNTVESMLAAPTQKTDGFEAALTKSAGTNADTEDVFEFGDILDIINPLHHLPVIGMIYRGLTDDAIKPMASIIGGGLFGGPMGAAGGIANAVIQHETGKDIAGNVFAIVKDETSNTASAFIQENFKDDPETSLTQAATSHGLSMHEDEHRAPPPPFAAQNLPGTALSFVDLSAPDPSITKTNVADGRTAGWTLERREQTTPPVQKFDAISLVANALPAREKISTVSISEF